jgi:hypothetical protein
MESKVVSFKKNSEDKFRPITGHEGTEGEQVYTTTLSPISALDGGEWLTPRPGRFSPEKT